ncbi:hypothetical protein [Enterobacter ludwigii]|uniref:hypothetical protein n=1 Tax=Enterobacter ludwigii TaxID=299767 RepID=UPI0039767443
MKINELVSALMQSHDVTSEENNRRKKEIERLDSAFNDYFFDGGKVGMIVSNAGIAEGAMGESSMFTSLNKTEIEVRLSFSTVDSQSKYQENFFLHVINGEYVISEMDGSFLCKSAEFPEKLFQRILSQI